MPPTSPQSTDGRPLCFALTATATQRREPEAREWLQGPQDLADWIRAAVPDLPPGDLAVDGTLLRLARDLREAVYRTAARVAEGSTPSAEDRRTINEWAARNDAVRLLDDAGARWQIPPGSPARTALSLVAIDAVEVLGGARDGTVKVCSGERCAAAFVDTSRGRSRRWCSMGTCGNRAKRSAMRARRTS
ncbi:CGNR zinc finger domain-containing protein [Promicromonospora sp. NPDC057138]|uniref:CGNR zinc finger domain-containing protein n=1 Tax=Promicromonospora sp. NPDC057138 TaxID=3346031 RepID=UPI00363CE7E7